LWPRAEETCQTRRRLRQTSSCPLVPDDAALVRSLASEPAISDFLLGPISGDHRWRRGFLELPTEQRDRDLELAGNVDHTAPTSGFKPRRCLEADRLAEHIHRDSSDTGAIGRAVPPSDFLVDRDRRPGEPCRRLRRW
jgi:hypothetical protein